MSTRESLPLEITHLVRDNCICLHVQRAARTIARHFDDALRPLGLTNGQFSLLISLNRPNPPSIGSVAKLLAMDRTTLTAALKPLERRRLVRIVADPEDKRSRRLQLTPSGKKLLKAAVPIWKREHGVLERQISSADRLRADLRALS
jgi:DNA-binding MarR family transcriptional regulator